MLDVVAAKARSASRAAAPTSARTARGLGAESGERVAKEFLLSLIIMPRCSMYGIYAEQLGWFGESM